MTQSRCFHRGLPTGSLRRLHVLSRGLWKILLGPGRILTRYGQEGYVARLECWSDRPRGGVVEVESMKLQTPLVLLVLAVLALPVAAAGDADEILPPRELSGTHHEGSDSVTLSWLPPESGPADAYNVYRNGQWIGSTDRHHFTTELGLGTTDPVAVFHVTALYVQVSTQEEGGGGGGSESGPSGPVAYGQGDSCGYVTTSFEPNKFPFVFVGHHPECFPGPTEGPGGILMAWRLLG